MRIAWLLDTFPSSSETFIARDIEALQARGFDIDVWALKMAGEGAHPVPRLSAFYRALPHQVAAIRGRFWANQCAGELRACDWLHAGWANFPANVVQSAARELSLPWSFSAHARDIWVDGRDLKRKLESARYAFCCTQAGATHLRALSPENAGKVREVRHGLPDEWFAPLPDWSPDSPFVLSAGRMVPKKGFDVMLHALANLRAEGVSTPCDHVGDGPEREKLRALEKKLVPNCVRWLGAQTPQWVQGWMRERGREGVFVMPSRVARDGDRDGVPNVLLEAMACGVPIVATRAGSIEELLDESCARLVPPDDARALAEAIAETFANVHDTRLRRANAFARVNERYRVTRTIEVMAQALAGES